MIPANHDSRIEAQQLPRERFSPLAEVRQLRPDEIDPLPTAPRRIAAIHDATGGLTMSSGPSTHEPLA